MEKTISISEYPEIKRLYDKAVAEGRKEFPFKGDVLLTAYAKYLLEYLEPRYNKLQ